MRIQHIDRLRPRTKSRGGLATCRDSSKSVSDITDQASKEPNPEVEVNFETETSRLSKMHQTDINCLWSRVQWHLRELKQRLRQAKPDDNSCTGECVACLNDIPKEYLVQLDCAHEYCRSCFSRLIETACQSEDSFPPRCCKVEGVSLQRIKYHAHRKARKKFTLMAETCAIAVEHRWYCPRANCRRPFDIRNAELSAKRGLQCPRCEHYICVTCRGPAHSRMSHCVDQGLQATLQLSKIERWRICSKCRNMIEHDGGCRHMRCICGHQFCYCCGKRWKLCRASKPCAEAFERIMQVETQRAQENAAAQIDDGESVNDDGSVGDVFVNTGSVDEFEYLDIPNSEEYS